MENIYFGGDGFYYTNITSSGLSLRQLIERCGVHGKHLTPAVEQVFKSAELDATVTNGFHRRIVIPSAKQFSDGGDIECTTARVMGWAAECDLVRLSFEASLLFCLKVSQGDIRKMGVRWVAVTCAVEGPQGTQDIAVFTDGHTIDIIFDHQDAWWLSGFGFAFSCELIDMEADESDLALRSMRLSVMAA